jgi:sulfite reductase (ferredoxin)
MIGIEPRTAPLPPETLAEIANIEGEIGRFLDGELSPERFRAFRLAHGIYGQRQPGVQMVRVKIPTGDLDGRQLARLADIAEEFSNGLLHLTTRQDVQFHYIRLERVGALLRRLAEAGLTTREACANSVRNVTACPLSGFIAEEAFEVQPYAVATYSYLVRNPFCQQMARKFKIAFSGCPEDCAATAIHDIGALAQVRGENGTALRGFKVVAGGGLGATPFLAQVVDDFVPVDELLPTIKAILKVFTEHGNRRSKMKARLKFVIHKVGIERFRALVREARAGLTEEERREADITAYLPGSSAAIPHASRPAVEDVPVAVGVGPGKGICRTSTDYAAFDRWLATSVRRHRDPARAVVTLMVPLGDVEAPRARALARLVTLYGEDRLRIARDQNVVLPSVSRADVRRVYEGLLAAGLAETGVGTALDVTSCPGADTCALGITSSKGLARAIRAELLPVAANGGLEALRGVTIKISGCPNSCGQHHIAALGLHGVVKTIDGAQVPAYQLHLGGAVGPGESRIGRALEKIPARHVPRAVAALLTAFGRDRLEGESFADFASRLPAERVREILKPFIERPVATEDLAIDWGQTERFTTDDLGTGECAGAGQDAVVDPFDNVRAELVQAALFMKRGQWVDALANLNRSQYTAARVLLDVLRKHPDSDYEVICELRAGVIDRGYAGEAWNVLHQEIEELLKTRRPDPERIRSVHDRTQQLVGEFRAALPALAAKAGGGAATEIPG